METATQKKSTSTVVTKLKIAANKRSRPVDRSKKLYDQIIREVKSYVGSPDLGLLRRAYIFASQAHELQLRRSGAPYIEHCMETAKILAELKMDVTTVAAGILHDVVEDTGIDIAEVRGTFGDEIALLVDGVTKISELKFQSLAEQQAENFRKMVMSMAKDLRVILIKFADRLHNMRTLGFLPESKARRIALETREVYSPLAHRFGIARIKWELEDLSLKILDPEIYDDLVRKVSESREDREKYIKKLARPLKHELLKQGIKAEVRGRAKSLYSIARKIHHRNTPYEEIYDLLAVRIIVERIDECYFALGVIHTLFTPVHDRFKDYIATPKLNMYQSLHTTVVGPEGRMLEIQVRTHEMHRIAEIGIAAHWKYKEGKQTEDELDQYSAWLREMVDLQKETLDPVEYMDILKTDLYMSEVFVFSPKGDLFNLAVDSTPVDFAFAVHTDIGLHCIGAKINGRIVPLNTKLKSGDSVEILVSSNQRPHQDWIIFVKTSKAKSKIKKWFKDAQFDDAVKLGEEILSKELKRLKVKKSKENLKDLVRALEKQSLSHLYAELGQGDLSLHRVLQHLAPDTDVQAGSDDESNMFKRFVKRARGSVRGVSVQGVDNLLIRFAQCCHPVPGDPIMGFITKGRGIMIHRRDCSNALQLMEQPERNIEVSWDVEGGEEYLVQLRIVGSSRKEFLREITESLSSLESNILKIDMNTENAIVTCYMILEVNDLSHLTKIIRRLYRIKGVLSVERGSGGNSALETSS